MAAPVVKLRRDRHGIEVTVRVTPEQKGQYANARVVGHVREGALVGKNGIRWTFR